MDGHLLLPVFFLCDIMSQKKNKRREGDICFSCDINEQTGCGAAKGAPKAWVCECTAKRNLSGAEAEV